MPLDLPHPEQLPLTADHYQWQGKPPALVPGRYGVVYDPMPRCVPWSELASKGKRISESQFKSLLYTLE